MARTSATHVFAETPSLLELGSTLTQTKGGRDILSPPFCLPRQRAGLICVHWIYGAVCSSLAYFALRLPGGDLDFDSLHLEPENFDPRLCTPLSAGRGSGDSPSVGAWSRAG